jgi:hypothetical protein
MRIAAMILLSAFLAIPATAARADDALVDQAKAALVAFTEAVLAGPDAVATILAPEYQIMRNNGVGYDREGYIAKGAGTVSARPDFSHSDIVATAHDDIMVVRYILRIDETIDGAPVRKSAPRLTVFRKIDGKWMVVAHANFGVSK